jgi:hypothetical protein
MFVREPCRYHFHTRQTLVRRVESEGFHVEHVAANHALYSRRPHAAGWIFGRIADWFPTFGAHLILFARRQP